MDSAASRLSTQTTIAADLGRAAAPPTCLTQAVHALSDSVVTWRTVLDKLRQGLTVFDGAHRLVLFNRRYAELYDLSPEDLRPGMTLREVAAKRGPGGAGLNMTHEEWATWYGGLAAQMRVVDTIVHLQNGRVLNIHHAPRPEGGWVATHDDITDHFRAREDLRQKATLLDATLAAMREKTGLLQLAQEAASAGLFDWNITDDAAHLSPESLRLFNLPEDRTTDLSGNEWGALIHPDDLPKMLREAERAAATGTTYRVEFRIQGSVGPDRWLLGIGRVLADGATQKVRIVGLNIDLTDRKHAEEALRANEAALISSQERLAFAMEAGSDGLWDWNIATGEVWFSDRWQTMLGYAPGELEGRISTWERLICPDDRDRAVSLLSAHFAGESDAYKCQHRLLCKDGSWGWVMARGKVVARDASNAPLRIVGTHIDIHAQKGAEGRVAYLASHDTLTDLPNRRLFRERLDHRLSELGDQRPPCAVLCLDLDRFKAVNDALGHAAGDTLLRTIAHRLRGEIREADMLARLGGDEFAIVLDNPGKPGHIAHLAARLIAAVRVPVPIGATQAEVGLSIGIAIAPQDGRDSDTLLNRADLALYRAKAAGRNTHRVFEPAMDEMTFERRKLEQDLRRALRCGEFVLHYQPQVRGSTGDIVGFEALVRWRHPTRGLLLPGTFIPNAEETGLIVELGEWVLRSACREAARWRAPLKIAVNVSPRQFQHADLAKMMATVLAETGLPPARLELEITEGVIINDMARALCVVTGLKELGVRIAMDDFGTGHSSLATLQAVPFDRIKIDRSFVGKVEASPQAAAIVRAVLGLGRSLGMGIVAEGVETEGQREFLNAEACDEMQGFLFGTPQPIDRFTDLLMG